MILSVCLPFSLSPFLVVVYLVGSPCFLGISWRLAEALSFFILVFYNPKSYFYTTLPAAVQLALPITK